MNDSAKSSGVKNEGGKMEGACRAREASEPVPKSPQDSGARFTVAKGVARSAALVLPHLVTFCGGSVMAFLLGLALKPGVQLRVTLTEPLPSIRNEEKLQILVIRNSGRKAAQKVTVGITWPRSVQPTDYRIVSLDGTVYETRTDTDLTFQVPRVAPGDGVMVILAVDGFSVPPDKIQVVHDEGKIEPTGIEYIQTAKWRNAQ